MGERAMRPAAAWAALADVLRAPDAEENDRRDRLATAAAAVWAVDAPGGREPLRAAGFDPAKPTEWDPQQDAVQLVLQAADGALAPPPEAHAFQRALERIRPGLYVRFTQWLLGQEMELHDVTGGTEQTTCDVIRSFFEFCAVEPSALQRLPVERELRKVHLVEAPEEDPQGPIELLVPLAPCTVHQAPADMFCPAEGQLVCARCLAPGGGHAGHNARMLRRAPPAGGDAEEGGLRHADPQHGAPRRGPDPAVGPRADGAGPAEGRGRGQQGGQDARLGAHHDGPQGAHQDGQGAAEEPVEEPAPEPEEAPVQEPQGPPLLGYPSRPLKVGERFEWLPSQLGPRGRQFALAGGELPKGVRLDDETGRLWGCPEEAGEGQCAVTCGEAGGEVAFAITAVEPWIRTIAGNGKQGQMMSNDPLQTNTSQPFGLAADADYVYVAQNCGARSVLRIPRRGGAPEVVAGGGDSESDGIPATAAKLVDPGGLALDGDRLYVCSGNKVRRVELRLGGLIHTVAGCGEAGHSGDGGPAKSAKLHTPYGVAVDGRTLYVAGRYEHAVRAVDLRSGLISTVAGNGNSGCSGDGGPATAARLYSPHDVCVSGGALYIADCSNHRVRRVDLATGLITTAAGGGEGAPDGRTAPTAAKVKAPRGLAPAGGGAVYIAENSSILLLRGGVLTPVVTAVEGGLDGPCGIALAGTALYVCDRENERVCEISNVVPPQPPASGPQAQQWSWAQGGQGAGMESPALRLHWGSAVCRLAFKKPPAGACVALSFAGAPQELELLLGAVGDDGRGAVALRHLDGRREVALHGARERPYFGEENRLEALVQREEDNDGGVTYTLSKFKLSPAKGRSVSLSAGPLCVTLGPDLPARIFVAMHHPDGGAEGPQLPFTRAPLLVEGGAEE